MVAVPDLGSGAERRGGSSPSIRTIAVAANPYGRIGGPCSTRDLNILNTLNITLDKKSATDALLTVTLNETDYQPKVTEKIKDFARKAQIKGFRPGKVPMGMIQRMYGKSILVEEINQLVSSSVNDYIRDQRLTVLGDPLPNEEKARGINWDTQRDFEFEFQIGMVDEFAYELSPKVKLTRHPIDVDEHAMDTTLTDLKERFGKTTNPEVSAASDNLYGEISAAGNEEKKGSFLVIGKLKKKEQKKFIGVKKEDLITFNIEDLADETAVVAQILNLSEEEAKAARGPYTFQVSSISRTEPAELNQELFDKVFGPGIVDSAEAFLAKVKETISRNYDRETNHLLDHEIEHYFVEHTRINLPDEFLKSWLKSSGNQQITDEVLEKEFKAYRNSLKWDLIRNKIADDHGVKVEGDEVRVKAKEMIAEQFGGIAFADQLGDRFDTLVNNYLAGQDGKGQQFMRIYNQLRNDKLMALIKEKITIQEKRVSVEQFKKITAEHKH